MRLLPKLPNRYLFSLAILVAGVGLSIAAFNTVRSRENQRIREEFRQQVDHLTSALEHSIADKLEVSQALTAFYAASGQVNRRQFQLFVQPFLGKHKGIHALSWVARVSGEDRLRYEQAIAAEGFPNFSIYQRDDTGKVSKQSLQVEYFPVTYTEPPALRQAIGYDMLSEPMRRDALMKAKHTGKTTLTEHINLVDNELGAIAFTPIYAAASNSTTRTLTGFVQVVFSLKKTVATAIENPILAALDFSIYDRSASAERQFIIRHEAKTNALLSSAWSDSDSSPAARAILCPSPSDCVRYIEVADRQWMLVAHPTMAYITSNREGTAYAIFSIGLLLTLGFVAYMLITQRHAIRVENLVQERTAQAQELSRTLSELQQTQAQLIQTEKMSSLGQLVAGVAHEINNPVNFIHGNLDHVAAYAQDLMTIVAMYQRAYPQPTQAIQAAIDEADLEFMSEDLPKLLKSMQVGTERIREIVLSLRSFSRLDEADMKAVDIHEGIDSTLLILQNRTKVNSKRPEIAIVKDYDDLPLIECYAGQLNQVFMNLLVNAIDAIDDLANQQRLDSNLDRHHEPWQPTITIRTKLVTSLGLERLESVPEPQSSTQSMLNTPLFWGRSLFAQPSQSNQQQPSIPASTQQTSPASPANHAIRISITDNGPGMSEETQKQLFNPFFTTKPVGKGTGLGLAISYQIVVDKHEGKLWCESTPGHGTTFFIEIPVHHAVLQVRQPALV
ncbi:MAG: CHASE domain-containing protein [Cyanobacteria bacterium]|nr:CHASE domain-containing protein [Cyanobacteriota bacterium]MDW8202673.1 CHASE domain-containing protein [Cyanobacteriota bacterium SKYGB_h_bin112]